MFAAGSLSVYHLSRTLGDLGVASPLRTAIRVSASFDPTSTGYVPVATVAAAVHAESGKSLNSLRVVMWAFFATAAAHWLMCYAATPQERSAAAAFERIAIQATNMASDLPSSFQQADRAGKGLLEAKDAKQVSA
jgi:hypothetical protein